MEAASVKSSLDVVQEIAWFLADQYLIWDRNTLADWSSWPEEYWDLSG